MARRRTSVCARYACTRFVVLFRCTRRTDRTTRVDDGTARDSRANARETRWFSCPRAPVRPPRRHRENVFRAPYPGGRPFGVAKIRRSPGARQERDSLRRGRRTGLVSRFREKSPTLCGVITRVFPSNRANGRRRTRTFRTSERPFRCPRTTPAFPFAERFLGGAPRQNKRYRS